MPSNPTALSVLQRRVWDGRLPLEIRLAPADCRSYADSEPYFIQYPRLSYLAFLLPRLHAFFAPKLINPDTPANEAWFEFETVPLKWHYPTGLLYEGRILRFRRRRLMRMHPWTNLCRGSWLCTTLSCLASSFTRWILRDELCGTRS
jgi:hypothetical protein